MLSPIIASPAYGEDRLRAVWVIGAAGIIVARVAWGVAKRRERAARIHPLTLVAGAFFLFLLLSLVGSINAWEGFVPLLVTGAAVAVCGALCSGVFSRAFLFRWGLHSFCVAALLIGGIGILQVLRWETMFEHNVAVSTLGNTNRSGALAAVLAPVAGALIFLDSHLLRRGLSAAGFAACVGLVVLSDSRAALIALIVGVLFTSTLLFLRRDLPGRRALGIVPLLIGIAFAARFDRVTSLFTPEDATRNVRTAMWPGAVRLALDHPILGCGIGNFRMAYPPYRDAEEFRLTQLDPKGFVEVEDPHSLYLHLWSEGGFLTLLAFLWVLYIFARMMRYHLRHAPDPDYGAAFAGLAGGALAFLVAGGATSADRFAGLWVPFWLILGTTEALARVLGRRTQPAGDTGITIFIVGVILSAFGLYHAVVRASANHEYLQAKQPASPEQRVEHLEKSIAIFYPQWRAQSELGHWLRNLPNPRMPEAQLQLERARSLHPNNVPILLDLAVVAHQRGKTELADDALCRAVEIAPFHFRVYYLRGSFRFDRGDIPGAGTDAEQALHLLPDHPRSLFLLACVRFRLGNPVAAKKLCTRAVNLSPEIREEPMAREILGDK